MRQPTVRRARRARQQRLLRTGIGLVVLIAIAAIVANLVGDGGTPRPTPTVTFVATYVGETQAASEPDRTAVEAEGEAILGILNDWYQRAFVDPKLYGDGTFPHVAENFAPEAREQFAKDLAALTIGQARTEVERVQPQEATATITVYFERASKPRLAIADVRFVATARLKERGALPLRIVQTAQLELKRTAKGWVIAYWKAKATQRQSLPASPTPTPS